MRAGELNKRITIQTKGTPTRDSFGAEVIAWSTFATVWAAVEPLSGREYLAAQQATATVDTRIRIRYFAGVLPEMRIVYGSRTFEIVSVINVKEVGRELQIMCREIV